MALFATVAMLLAAGVYNDAAAPPSPTAYEARMATLDGGPDGAGGPQVALAGPRVAIGSHHVLDEAAARFHPVDGGASFSANASGMRDATATGDVFAWVEGGGPPSVHIRDFARGTSTSVAVPEGLEPVAGHLIVSDSLAVWPIPSNDVWRVAGFVRADLAPREFDIPLPGNLTPLAAVGWDLFLAQPAEDDRLWLYNASTQLLRQVAEGDGVQEVSAGGFFAAWVNRSVPQAEYLDLASGRVESIPGPAGVRAQWVRASPTAVLVGGLRGGLFGDSPSAWHYDFPTGDAQVYSDLGVELDGAVVFGLADRTVVAVSSRPLPREAAPLTPHLLAAGLGGMLVTVYLGTRDALQGQD